VRRNIHSGGVDSSGASASARSGFSTAVRAKGGCFEGLFGKKGAWFPFLFSDRSLLNWWARSTRLPVSGSSTCRRGEGKFTPLPSAGSKIGIVQGDEVEGRMGIPSSSWRCKDSNGIAGFRS
jgi:hypothetical protein